MSDFAQLREAFRELGRQILSPEILGLLAVVLICGFFIGRCSV